MKTIEHTSPALNSGTKLSDAIESDYSLLNVLLRLGINLGFGERTIEEVCRENGINTDTFLLIANVYSDNDYIPSDKFISTASAEDLVKYLHASHSYYMDYQLQHLEGLLEELVKPCTEAQKHVIMRFFAEYKIEVKNHFDYEEDIVFPYVEAVTKGNVQNDYRISNFEEHHNNIDEKLNDLRNIVMKYLPQVCDSTLAVKVLFHLRDLEEDLEKHTIIEDSVLIPMVNRIEENVRR